MNSESASIITFSYQHKGTDELGATLPQTNVTYQIDGESNISELCNAFENFLLSCGFRLHEEETIGILRWDID
jgi:hypothetical protein